MAHVSNILADIAIAGTPLTTHELISMGISRGSITRLVEDGRLQRPIRGVYRTPRENDDQFYMWACVTKAYPEAVVCLFSAAVFHGMTESMGSTPCYALPHSVRPVEGWAIEGGAQFLRLRNDRDLSLGVITTRIDGVDVSITSPERTLVDMFRYSSYFKRSQRMNTSVDPEGFQDALHRYQNHPSRKPDTLELRKIARELGVWDELTMVINAAQSTKAAFSAN